MIHDKFDWILWYIVTTILTQKEGQTQKEDLEEGQTQKEEVNNLRCVLVSLSTWV